GCAGWGWVPGASFCGVRASHSASGEIMLIDDFQRRFDFLQRMTVDFVAAVPDAQWHYSPSPPQPDAQAPPLRHGAGFAPFCKQLRHVVCVRGVYREAIATQRANFARKHAHYTGGLGRAELSAALVESHRTLLAAFASGDANAPIDFFGRPFSLGDIAFTVVQHEAIHHGQWSVYAGLGGFPTPPSWRMEWGL